MVAGLVVGNVFFALVPMLMVPLFGEIVAEGLPIEPFSYASPLFGIYVLMFSIAFILADELSRSLAANWRRPVTSVRPPLDTTFTEFRYVFVFATVCLAITFFNSGKLSGAHWAAHADTGIIGSILSALALSLRSYLFAHAIIVLRNHRARTMLIMIIFTVLDIILTGNRITALYFALAVFFSGAFSYKTLILTTVIFLPVGFTFVVFYPAFRGVVWSQFGGFSGFAEALKYVWINGLPTAFDPSNIYKLFEGGNVAVFQYIFESYGHNHEFLYGETVIVKPLTFFIPREIFLDKPLGLGIRLGSDIFGFQGLSLNSLLIGEFYANFGWFGPLAILVIISVVMTLLRSSHAFQEKQYQLSLFVIAFASWRHEFNYIFFSFFLLAFVIKAIKLLVRVRIRVKQPI